ncbi:DUF2867 domain-containing protein [Oerskovia sp. M15]
MAGPRARGPVVRRSGLRRGRRDENRLVVDDVLDFWRVEAIEPGRRLLLRAEMRLRVSRGSSCASTRRPRRSRARRRRARPEDASGPDRSFFAQRALFYPHGLAGQAYWWAVKPFHGVVFGGMQKNISRAAELAAERAAPAERATRPAVSPPR